MSEDEDVRPERSVERRPALISRLKRAEALATELRDLLRDLWRDTKRNADLGNHDPRKRFHYDIEEAGKRISSCLANLLSHRKKMGVAERMTDKEREEVRGWRARGEEIARVERNARISIANGALKR